MMAASGTLPHAGDWVRIDQRAVPELPPGADLRVVDTAPSTIPGWAYLTVLVDAEHPPQPHRVLVPVASVTIYPGGRPT
jgi:hypothetical protein